MFEHVFMQILSMSMRGSLVILAVMLVRLLLKKAPKIYSYLLWSVVLFRLLCPVSIPSPVSVVPEVPDLSVTYTPTETTTVHLNLTEDGTVVWGVSVPELNPVQQGTPTNEVPQVASFSWAELLPIARYIWLSGIAILGLYSLLAYLRLRLQLRNAIQANGNIYLSGRIPTAFVLGLIRPRIYLPTFLAQEERGYILAHEQHHIRRLDHLWKLLAFLTLLLHWFNPLVWCAYILLCKDMEMSCDEAVIRKLGSEIRANYAASLLNLATGRKTVSVIPLAFGEGDTKGRVKNMSKWKKPKLWICILAAVLIVSVAVVLLTDPQEQEQPYDYSQLNPIEVGSDIPEGVMDVIQSWAGWTGEGPLWMGSLNASKLQYNSVQHLPIHKFDTRQELESFMGNVGKFLTMNDSSKGVPSFYGTASRYDEAFFAEYSLVLVYIPSANSGRTFRVSGTEINSYTDSFVVEVQETANAQVKEPKQSGWFITMAISDSDIAGCAEFDAVLNTRRETQQLTLAYVRSEEDLSYYNVEALVPITDLSRIPAGLKAAVEKEWRTHDQLPKMDAMASSHLWGTVYENATTWQEAQSKVGLNISNPLESLSFVQKRDFYALGPATADEAHIQITVMATESTDRQISQINLRSGYSVDGVRVNLYTTVWNVGGVYTTGGGFSGEGLLEFSKGSATTGSGKEVLIVRQVGAEHYSTLNTYWLDGNVLYSMSLTGEAGEEEKLETVLVRILKEI